MILAWAPPPIYGNESSCEASAYLFFSIGAAACPLDGVLRLGRAQKTAIIVPSHARFGFLNYHRAKWLLILPLGVRAAKQSSDRIGFAVLCVVKDAPDYP
jgi:hypothetical protein